MFYLGTCIARISPVLTVLAIDNDIFPNNDVQYSLLDSADNRFGINASTGEIFVNDITKLDYESMQSHTLQVQSSDGTFTDSAIVYIPVGDVNDNPPNFFENSYNIPVLETSAIGTTILVVQVVFVILDVFCLHAIFEYLERIELNAHFCPREISDKGELLMAEVDMKVYKPHSANKPRLFSKI